jgi:hypothetical protein
MTREEFFQRKQIIEDECDKLKRKGEDLIYHSKHDRFARNKRLLKKFVDENHKFNIGEHIVDIYGKQGTIIGMYAEIEGNSIAIKYKYRYITQDNKEIAEECIRKSKNARL